MVKIVCAITLDRAIGVYPNNSKKGRLPWEPEEGKGDLAYFKQLTKDQSVIMGRRTFESIDNKPLPFRNNTVVANKWGQDVFPDQTVMWAKNLESAIGDASLLGKDIYLIGGENIFSEGFKYADEIIMTILPIKAYERFDTENLVYFPPITNNFHRFEEIEHPISPSFRIIRWKKMGGKQNERKNTRRKPTSLS